MTTLKINMQNTSTVNTIIEWLADNWAKIGLFILAFKFTDSFFSWLTKRSEARIKQIYSEQYTETVKPEITRLSNSIDSLKESIWELKDKIK